MKIAMFGHKHIFTTEGGIEVVISELVKRMAKDNNVIVYDRYELDKKSNVQRDPTIDYTNIQIKKSPTFSKSAINAQMASFFSTLSCAFGNQDITHVHAEGPCVFLSVMKLFRKKIVVTIHGIDWQRAKWGKFARWYIRLGEKMAAKYADAIIVLSEDAKKYFKDTYDRDTVMIRNGVSVERTNETDKIQEFGLTPGDYVLYLGRFAPEKRVDLLYEAFSSEDTISKLVLAGPEADLNKESDWYKKASADSRVIFTGHAEGALKQQLFSHTAAFVLPSDLEGMSVSLLEALAYGCNVITSDIAENKMILHGFGTTFKTGDKDDLAEKLRALQPLTEESRQTQCEYFEKHYNWDHVVEETLRVYENVIHGHKDGI